MGWFTGDSPEDIMKVVNPQIAQAEGGYNQYLDMLKAALGGYDWNQPQRTTSTGTSTTSQRTTPFLTPEYKKMEGLWRGVLEGRLKGGSALPEGYLGAAARGTNQAYEGARVAAQNLAARRGLSGEQALSIAEPIEIARAGKIADVANQIPLLGRQLQNEDIQLASQLAELFGKGTSMTGTTTTTGETISPADMRLLLAFLQMLKPYERPLVVPGGRQGVLAPLIGAGGQVAAGALYGGGGGGGGGNQG